MISNIKLLGGEPADTSVSQDMASHVINAARRRRGASRRWRALPPTAAVMEGMGLSATLALSDLAEGINLANDLRKGTTQTLRDHAGDSTGEISAKTGHRRHDRQSVGQHLPGSAFAKSNAGQSLKSAF